MPPTTIDTTEGVTIVTFASTSGRCESCRQFVEWRYLVSFADGFNIITCADCMGLAR